MEKRAVSLLLTVMMLLSLLPSVVFAAVNEPTDNTDTAFNELSVTEWRDGHPVVMANIKSADHTDGEYAMYVIVDKESWETMGETVGAVTSNTGFFMNFDADELLGLVKDTLTAEEYAYGSSKVNNNSLVEITHLGGNFSLPVTGTKEYAVIAFIETKKSNATKAGFTSFTLGPNGVLKDYDWTYSTSPVAISTPYGNTNSVTGSLVITNSGIQELTGITVTPTGSFTVSGIANSLASNAAMTLAVTPNAGLTESTTGSITISQTAYTTLGSLTIPVNITVTKDLAFAGATVNGLTVGAIMDPVYLSATVTGTKGALTFEKVSGEFPRGITMAADGTISGTPEAYKATDTAVEIRVTDDGRTGSVGDENTKTATVTFGAIAKGTQTGTVTPSAATSVTYGAAAPNIQSSFSVSGTKSYASTDSTVATVGTDGKVTILKTGSFQIGVTNTDPNENYEPLTVTSGVITVQPGEQVLTTQASFGYTAVYTGVKSLAGAVVNDKENAGGADVTYAITGTNTAGATLTNGGLGLTFTTAGSVEMTASAAAVTGKYNAATPLTFTIQVIPGNPTTLVEAPKAGTYTYGMTLGALGLTGGKVTDDDNGGAVLTGGKWTFNTPNVTPNVSDSGTTLYDVTYNQDGYVPQTTKIAITVNKADQAAPVLSGTALSIKNGDTDTVTTSGSGFGDPIYVSTNDSIVEVNATTGAVTAKAVGTAEIRVSYAGDTNHNPSAQTSLTVTVYDKPIVTAIAASGDGKLDVTVTANKNGSDITQYNITLSGIRYTGGTTTTTTYAIKFTSGGAVQTVTSTSALLLDRVSSAGGMLIYTDPATGTTYGGVSTGSSVTTAKTTTGAVYTANNATGRFTIPNLINGTTYTITATAVNAAGTSDPRTITAKPAVASTDRPSGGGGGGGSVSTYTVTYDPGDHGKVEKTTESVANGNSPKGVKVTADEGWVFAGWSKDGKTVIDLKDIKVTEAMKLIAVYEKDDKIVIPDSVPEDLRFLQVSKGEISGGYVSGYTDGTFRPDNAITRAEVAAIVAKTINYEKEKGKSYTNTPFGDVARSEWYADDIGFVASLGVIAGYKDGTFKPNSNITRAEFVTMAMKIDRVVNSGKSFKDMSDADWYAEYVKSAAEKGYATGYLDGTFRPNNPITRAEAVTIINAIIGLDPASGQISFSDVAESHWAYRNIKAAAEK